MSQHAMAQLLIDKSDVIKFFDGDHENIGQEVHSIPLNSVTFYENVSAPLYHKVSATKQVFSGYLIRFFLF